MILLDLSTALLASRVTLMHVVDALQGAGHEVAVWSALDRRTSRDALIAAGILECFDDVYHMDGMTKMDDFGELSSASWLHIEDFAQPRATLKRFGVKGARMPQWLGWLE